MTRSTERPTAAEALNRLTDRCSAAEMCSGEALDKLRAWGIEGDEAYTIIDKLTSSRFIDDERFARAYVRSKTNYAKWGRLKIRNSLRLKRIDPAIIDVALDEEIDTQAYYENLAAALRAKARTMGRQLTRDDKARLVRFAAGRGYEPSLVMEMLPEEDFWRTEP